MSHRVTTRSQSVHTDNTPKNKRTHSPQEPGEEKTTKKHKTNTLSAMDFAELKKLITQSSEAIENKIYSSQKSLESKFSELAIKVEGDVSKLKSSMDEFKAEVSGELHDVKVQLSSNTPRIDNTEDDIQRIQRSSDLRVIGFPVKENENLFEIFKAIANEIGFEINSQFCTPTIERIPIKNRITGEMLKSHTVLIQFPALKQKQSFYLNKMPLKPENFGLPAANRIIIGENLTRKNAQLFKQAQIMRKDRKIAQTFTEDGIVKIKLKKGKNEQTYTVRNTITLESIVAKYVPSTTSTSAALQSSADRTNTEAAEKTTDETTVPTLEQNNDKGEPSHDSPAKSNTNNDNAPQVGTPAVTTRY